MANENDTNATVTAEEITEQAQSTESNGKRKYTKRAPTFPEFNAMELFALRAILNGDSNVNSGWRSHLLARVEAFIPSAPDLSQPPTAASTTNTVSAQ